MKRIVITALLALPILTAHAQYKSEVWCPDNGDGTYTNPVINADYSDPDVICVGDDYYLTASSFNCMPGLPILHSKDLVNWEIIGHALHKQYPDSSKPPHGAGVYAPSIRYHKNEFYIYWGDLTTGCYMVKAKDPRGPWSDPLMVVKSKGMIDTCPLWDDDGRCYLVNGWGNSAVGFNNLLTVRELSADGTKTIGDPVIVFDGGLHGLSTVEGPKFYKRDGWYWILCPAGGVGNGPQLAMRSKSPYGPYEYKEVLDRGKTAIHGPHQGGWVHTPFGEDWFMHFQNRGVYGRVTHLQPVDWSSGWPVMGKKGEPYVTYRKPKSSSSVIVNPAESDEFNEPSLGKQWQWENDYNELYGMTTCEGVYRLFTMLLPFQTTETNLWNVPNLLLQKTPCETFTVTAKVKMVSLNENQRGGIVSFGRSYAALVMEREGHDMYLRQVVCERCDSQRAKEQVTTLAKLNLGYTPKDGRKYPAMVQKELYLRMYIHDGKGRFAYSEDGKKYKDVGTEFALDKARWIGTKVGLTCTEANEKGRRGYMDVDWFRITK